MDKVSTPLALTAAALFVAACGGSQAPAEDASSVAADPAAPAADTASAETVKCQGIHECKGQSQCGVPGGHACAGQNDCKGKGWIKVPKAECDEKGGTVL